MRASILLTALATATAACAVSPDVSPYPPDAQNGMTDAAGPGGDGGGPPPDARPMSDDAGGPGTDAGPGGSTVGWPVPFDGSQVLISPETLFAFRLPPIDVDGSLLGWGVIPADTSSALIAMALYTDGGGQPAELISWTERWSPDKGVFPGTGTPVPEGEYWLVLLTDGELLLGQDPGQPIELCLLAHPSDAAFPEPFGTPAECTTTGAPNLYIQLGPVMR
jgi:hypothetical protein